MLSAPQNPTPTSAPTAGGTAAPSSTPSTSEATTFTMNVPHGKRAPLPGLHQAVGRVAQRGADRRPQRHQQRGHRRPLAARASRMPTQVAVTAATGVPTR